MGKFSFIVKQEYRPFVEVLTDEEAGQLFKGLFGFNESGEFVKTGNRSLDMLMGIMCYGLAGANAQYDARCEVNRRNGRMGGGQPGNQNARKRPKTSETSETSENERNEPNRIDKIRLEENNKKEIFKEKRFDFISENLQKTFADWLEYKLSDGAVRNEKQVRMMFEELQRLSGGDRSKAEDIVRFSIASGYKSLCVRQQPQQRQQQQGMNVGVHLQCDEAYLKHLEELDRQDRARLEERRRITQNFK